MAKYVFKVFDYDDSNKQIAQVITNTDDMIESVKVLNQLGIVKGFIIDNDNRIVDDKEI